MLKQSRSKLLLTVSIDENVGFSNKKCFYAAQKHTIELLQSSHEILGFQLHVCSHGYLHKRYGQLAQWNSCGQSPSKFNFDPPCLNIVQSMLLTNNYPCIARAPPHRVAKRRETERTQLARRQSTLQGASIHRLPPSMLSNFKHSNDSPTHQQHGARSLISRASVCVFRLLLRSNTTTTTTTPNVNRFSGLWPSQLNMGVGVSMFMKLNFRFSPQFAQFVSISLWFFAPSFRQAKHSESSECIEETRNECWVSKRYLPRSQGRKIGSAAALVIDWSLNFSAQFLGFGTTVTGSVRCWLTE